MAVIELFSPTTQSCEICPRRLSVKSQTLVGVRVLSEKCLRLGVETDRKTMKRNSELPSISVCCRQ